jgi:hypothetical protein
MTSRTVIFNKWTFYGWKADLAFWLAIMVFGSGIVALVGAPIAIMMYCLE